MLDYSTLKSQLFHIASVHGEHVLEDGTTVTLVSPVSEDDISRILMIAMESNHATQDGTGSKDRYEIIKYIMERLNGPSQ
jgi:hypothetical protein